ncbi:DUF6993 domain-containing protein [Microbacterium sp. P03]|uniref:DUF6993 domain-containing protein n=1 Tax=Microbacterium sp. P03 TaxID=3366946 RepID=UPI0037464B1E
MPRLPEPRSPMSIVVPDRSRHVRFGVATVAIALLLAVTGCSADSTPSPTVTPPDAAPSASASTAAEPATPAAPALVPGGSAADNLPVFTATVNAVWAGPDQVSGRAYIDALVGAGFDKSAMQVTSDSSTVGNPAESIQFSVLWGTECLVGQVGPATGTAVSVVLPALAEGGCLIGETRPIDW